jgi:hypothetical protein
MKKLALILALLIIPCTAFGLEMLNDASLDGVTGQAGIDIAMDDIQIFMNIEKMAWIDCDGYTSLGRMQCSGAGGAIALNNFQIDVLNVNAILTTNDNGSDLFAFNPQTGGNLALYSASCGKIPLFYNYASTAPLGCGLNVITSGTAGIDNFTGTQPAVGGYSLDGGAFTPQFLSIDVTDKLPCGTEGLQVWNANSYTSAAVAAKGGNGSSTIGGVIIGLPTVEFYIGDMMFEPVYDGDISGNTSNAINDDTHLYSNFGNDYASFGVIQMHGITFTVLSGWIEIAPH